MVLYTFCILSPTENILGRETVLWGKETVLCERGRNREFLYYQPGAHLVNSGSGGETLRSSLNISSSLNWLCSAPHLGRAAAGRQEKSLLPHNPSKPFLQTFFPCIPSALRYEPQKKELCNSPEEWLFTLVILTAVILYTYWYGVFSLQKRTRKKNHLLPSPTRKLPLACRSPSFRLLPCV